MTKMGKNFMSNCAKTEENVPCNCPNKKQTARCFISVNILLSHSRSLKMGTSRKLGYSFPQ